MLLLPGARAAPRRRRRRLGRPGGRTATGSRHGGLACGVGDKRARAAGVGLEDRTRLADVVALLPRFSAAQQPHVRLPQHASKRQSSARWAVGEGQCVCGFYIGGFWGAKGVCGGCSPGRPFIQTGTRPNPCTEPGPSSEVAAEGVPKAWRCKKGGESPVQNGRIWRRWLKQETAGEIKSRGRLCVICLVQCVHASCPLPAWHPTSPQPHPTHLKSTHLHPRPALPPPLARRYSCCAADAGKQKITRAQATTAPVTRRLRTGPDIFVAAATSAAAALHRALPACTVVAASRVPFSPRA
jgi:hypothetical protein